MPKQRADQLVVKTLSVEQGIAANITGDLTGNVTGDVTGNVTGDVTGNVTGDLTGNVTGNVTGTHVGGQQDSVTAASGDGAIAITPKTVFITKGSAAALTLAAPTATTHDGIIIRIVAATAHAHTITATTIGYNAADAAGDVATLGGAIGDGLTVIAYQGEWYILYKTNATLS